MYSCIILVIDNQ